MIKEKQNEISQLQSDLANFHAGTTAYIAIECRILLLQNDIKKYENAKNKAHILPPKSTKR